MGKIWGRDPPGPQRSSTWPPSSLGLSWSLPQGLGLGPALLIWAPPQASSQLGSFTRSSPGSGLRLPEWERLGWDSEPVLGQSSSYNLKTRDIWDMCLYPYYCSGPTDFRDGPGYFPYPIRILIFLCLWRQHL